METTLDKHSLKTHCKVGPYGICLKNTTVHLTKSKKKKISINPCQLTDVLILRDTDDFTVLFSCGNFRKI